MFEAGTRRVRYTWDFRKWGQALESLYKEIFMKSFHFGSLETFFISWNFLNSDHLHGLNSDSHWNFFLIIHPTGQLSSCHLWHFKVSFLEIRDLSLKSQIAPLFVLWLTQRRTWLSLNRMSCRFVKAVWWPRVNHVAIKVSSLSLLSIVLDHIFFED